MKKKNPAERTTKCFSFTAPPDLVPLIRQMAQENGRTVSSYLCWLIARDTKNFR
jgi:hypothetical protein